jgi:hypothetical protein
METKETPKFLLTDATTEEQQAFMTEFMALLEKHSLYYEPCPQFARDDAQSPWKVVVQVILQKKTPIDEKTTEKTA